MLSDTDMSFEHNEKEATYSADVITASVQGCSGWTFTFHLSDFEPTQAILFSNKVGISHQWPLY